MFQGRGKTYVAMRSMKGPAFPMPGVRTPLALKRDDFLAAGQRANLGEDVDFRVKGYPLVMATHREKHTQAAWDTFGGSSAG